MSHLCTDADLISRKLAWLLWYGPLGFFIIGAFWSQGRPWVWTPSLAVAGIACIVNAARCGRFHCFLTGPLYLLGATATVVRGFGIEALQWNWIFAAMLGGSVLAFVPEWVGRKYI